MQQYIKYLPNGEKIKINEDKNGQMARTEILKIKLFKLAFLILEMMKVTIPGCISLLDIIIMK